MVHAMTQTESLLILIAAWSLEKTFHGSFAVNVFEVVEVIELGITMTST